MEPVIPVRQIPGRRHPLQWEVPIKVLQAGSVAVTFCCPFCGVDVIHAFGAYDHDEVEAELRDHLLEEHPIRWRLSRRFRRAMRRQ